jgi:hypothetical protein
MLTTALTRFQNYRAITSFTQKLSTIKPKMMLGLSLSVLISCSASLALADDAGPYAGLGIANTAATEQGINSSKIGIRLTGGYQFNKYFASEIGLFSTGDHTKLGMKGYGASLSVLGQYPIYKRLNIFAEFGGVIVDLKIDEDNTTVDRTGAESLQDGNDPGFFMAYGLTYDIEDWTLAFKMSEVDTDADLTITSLNLYLHF